MPGALIHITAGLISALMVHRYFKKLEFSIAIFLGNLLPDVLKISYLAMYHKTFSVNYLIQSEFHQFTHYLVNGFWFTFMFFLFWVILGWFLYHYHFVKKRKFKEWEEFVMFLLIGYLTHLILDYYSPFFHNLMPMVPIWI